MICFNHIMDLDKYSMYNCKQAITSKKADFTVDLAHMHMVGLANTHPNYIPTFVVNIVCAMALLLLNR